MAQDFNSTLNLPKTDFPMRAGLPKREPEMLKHWEELDLYNELLTGSGASSLTNLENAINEQCAKGYRLHTISTTSSGSKGWLGGDKIQATMVFESLKLGKQ